MSGLANWFMNDRPKIFPEKPYKEVEIIGTIKEKEVVVVVIVVIVVIVIVIVITLS